ncbi:YdbL family protein [Croceicoccus sp. F390]|uniref:YdbL family protein n=1 Tax=Croceicoccus esteveae TaxID=3075597 RepID=A0ABU2ZJU5_9SPHN|nr:YdbL family protein [Croceicoccus sp. F390]MDT0576660.1 YdbL family protein [Croceicoccus sp. F390]
MTLAIRSVLICSLAGLMIASAPASAMQREPAYASARATGAVGEKIDGYLGFTGAPAAALRAVVDDINIRRKASYADRARAAGVTIEEFGFTQGCLLIARTAPGEKYQSPDGSWQTRGSGPAVLDPRCPTAR